MVQAPELDSLIKEIGSLTRIAKAIARRAKAATSRAQALKDEYEATVEAADDEDYGYDCYWAAEELESWVTDAEGEVTAAIEALKEHLEAYPRR